jgi:hypothetical protein
MTDAVDPAYRHHAKVARFVTLSEAAGARLKIYEIAAPGAEIAGSVRALADGWLAKEAANIVRQGDCGFLIVHKCGADFHFLLPGVWRGANELWEAVWYQQGAMEAFLPFDPAYPPEGGPPRPTFCVWELGVVAHEAGCWGRYLGSARDAAALGQWQEDVFSGPV